MASARAPAQAYGDTAPAGGGGGAVGGYNFQRIMDDHFEHYKRPASRERSVDKVNLPSALSEAAASASTSVSALPNVKPRGRSGSRQPLNISQPSQPQPPTSFLQLKKSHLFPSRMNNVVVKLMCSYSPEDLSTPLQTHW